MPEYLEDEIKFLKKISTDIKTNYVLYLNICDESINNFKLTPYIHGIGEFNFFHYKCKSDFIYANKDLINFKKNENFFIHTKENIFSDIINSQRISYLDISVIPDFIYKIYDKKFFIILMSYLANKFNPNISYNDLISNLQSLNYTEIIKF